MLTTEQHRKSPNLPKKRILFIGEAVTLSHIIRPLAFAESLDLGQYEIFFACDPRSFWVLKDCRFPLVPLESISPETFLKKLAQGEPLYNAPTLRKYVRNDVRVLERVKPDLVVGDFRLSLSVSAKLMGIPYATITNAYWSPYAGRPFDIPDHIISRIFGPRVGRFLFRLSLPFIHWLHARPLNQVRKEFGLKPLPNKLGHIYTHADFTLYADHPAFYPSFKKPPTHLFVGSPQWKSTLPFPKWWDSVPSHRPVVYVNLGSSGEISLYPKIIKALSEIPVTALLATAGRAKFENLPPNIFMADFLPGEACCEKADLVVTNGGSLSTTQALRLGKPVLGIVTNLDQHLSMNLIVKVKAGLKLRSERLDRKEFKKALQHLLTHPLVRMSASIISRELKDHDPKKEFARFVSQHLKAPTPHLKSGPRLIENHPWDIRCF